MGAGVQYVKNPQNPNGPMISFQQWQAMASNPAAPAPADPGQNLADLYSAPAPEAPPVDDPWISLGNESFSSPAASAPPIETPAVAPAATPVAETPIAPPADPWAAIAATYGLSAPPAQGMPAPMHNTPIGAAPQTQASQIDLSKLPQPAPQQMAVSPEIRAMAGGQGYSPEVVTNMKTHAMQDASTAGIQEMGQMKRILGQNGISGGANAAVLGDVARRTGENQRSATGAIDVNNAQVGNDNAKFGIGQSTLIGQNNMQAANAMALSNANQMFQGLQSNQTSNNQANQMNTGLAFQRQENQAGMDFNTQKSQWDELNKRYGQSQNILGSWGAGA